MPSSLLEIFDQILHPMAILNTCIFPGIAGVAAGSGINGEEDTNGIANSRKTMISRHILKTDDTIQNIPVDCIRAREGYKNLDV